MQHIVQAPKEVKYGKCEERKHFCFNFIDLQLLQDKALKLVRTIGTLSARRRDQYSSREHPYFSYFPHSITSSSRFNINHFNLSKYIFLTNRNLIQFVTKNCIFGNFRIFRKLFGLIINHKKLNHPKLTNITE